MPRLVVHPALRVCHRLRWMTRPLSIIDLIALVPFYLEICIQYDAFALRAGVSPVHVD